MPVPVRSRCSRKETYTIRAFFGGQGHSKRLLLDQAYGIIEGEVVKVEDSMVLEQVRKRGNVSIPVDADTIDAAKSIGKLVGVQWRDVIATAAKLAIEAQVDDMARGYGARMDAENGIRLHTVDG